MVNFKCIHIPTQIPLQRYPNSQILRFSNPSECVQDRVKSCIPLYTSKMCRLNPEISTRQTKLLNQVFDSIVQIINRQKVLIQSGLYRSGETPPYSTLEIPVEKAILFNFCREHSSLAINIPSHNRDSIIHSKNTPILKAQTISDEV